MAVFFFAFLAAFFSALAGAASLAAAGAAAAAAAGLAAGAAAAAGAAGACAKETAAKADAIRAVKILLMSGPLEDLVLLDSYFESDPLTAALWCRLTQNARDLRLFEWSHPRHNVLTTS
ncbi:MAG: hypothetical protein EAZ30_08540 [Betaproteobacteria bacterium]|nr:MAG: hypothetical protein EAZ30_08540 [Betaproteobacteria bacterium]